MILARPNLDGVFVGLEIAGMLPAEGRKL